MTSTLPSTDAVSAALDRLAAGGVVVVLDDADRENEGDLVAGADTMTPAQMAFFVRHGTGIVCVPMEGADADRLDLPLMVETNTESHHTAFTVPVDHVSTGTGVSATDRAATARALADAATAPDDLRRPGHVYPLRARDGGVLCRAGHTEAAVDLLRLAGRTPVGVITELVADHGDMLRGQPLLDFAAEHDLPVLTVADLVRHRRATEELAVPTGSAHIPTRHGTFRATAFRSEIDGQEHLALTLGDIRGDDPVLVRVHSECLTGDVLGSLKCDCGTQLDAALDLIGNEGRGAVVYLRGHEGRGIGLGHKLRAYALQEQGRDTVDANADLGLPVDARTYGTGAAILAHLGIRRIRLITNNPSKYGGLAGHDLDIVERVTLPPLVTAENLRYLTTKRDRMHHDLPVSDAPRLLPASAVGGQS
jgi:3,4-dihydroxy 2-butanone 4-phosphate synthase/GTP cyclohydrolase II